MTQLEAPLASATANSDKPIPVAWVVAIATSAAAIVALSVSAQTYLLMLSHGHSFARIFLWQMSFWSFWAFAAPFVMRRGAQFVGAARRWQAVLRLLVFGLILITTHGLIAAQTTVWLQPFVPVETYRFTQVFLGQLPSRFAVDLLVYAMMLVGGGAFAAHHRARRFELRESQLEAELARAQLHALRLEIEPHFLFNTLNAIAALIRSRDNARALDVLVGLSTFMRSNLDDPQEPFVALSTELDWVKRYIGLQQARFGERLEVSYDIDDGCLDAHVPTLLLQPIVENAFRHGVGRQVQRSRIVIGATRESQRLVLRVADDGIGVSSDFDVTRETGTGLRNTRSRLEHSYGSAAALEIRRGERGGTIVTMTLPLATARWEGKATA